MGELALCGYRCDLCKAFAANIKANDQRKTLSEKWMKYYGLDIPADSIFCEGAGATVQTLNALTAIVLCESVLSKENWTTAESAPIIPAKPLTCVKD